MKWLQRLCVVALLCAPLAARAEGDKPKAGVVNITNASVEELERLPGIGEKKASAIVEHRKTHPMRKLEDLTKVKGIGRKTVSRLRPYLTLAGPTTLTDRPSTKK